MADIMPLRDSVRHTRRHLSNWMRNRNRSDKPDLSARSLHGDAPTSGVVGVISPWNYPLNLALEPTLEALAAGNRVMICRANSRPGSLNYWRKPWPGIPADVLRVVTGGVEMAQEFAALPWDHSCSSLDQPGSDAKSPEPPPPTSPR
jgi:coniferyl-aldehyde dehydrogenase